MKKMLIAVSVLLSLSLLCGCGLVRKTAKGRNAKIDFTGTAHVSFYPVCPECDHVSPCCSVDISDGEYEEGTYMCEKCYEIYEILIDRR